MDKLTDKKFIRIIYLSLAATLAYNALHAGDRLWLLLFLSGLMALSATVRHMLLLRNMRHTALRCLAYLPDLVLAFLIGMFVSQDGSVAFFLIVLCDACLFLPRLAGYGVTAAGIVAYALCCALNPGRQALQAISLVSGAFLAAVALVSIARHEMETRQDRERTMYELKTKSKELEDAYSRLREATKAQEEVAALQERSRIAAEMHDTVGHALTGGLLCLEAGERMLPDDSGQAAEKIGIAKEQVRKGLAELRRAVHALGSEDLGLVRSARRLLDDMRRQGLSIHEDVSELPVMSQQKQDAFLRALQEGLANGIRHGGSTAFVFRLKREGDVVLFLLEDNGCGCEAIRHGFGLETMARRVTAAGGSLAVRSDPGEGFQIDIRMPVEG